MDLSNYKLPKDANPPQLSAYQLDNGVARYSGHKKGLGFRFFVHKQYNPLKSKLLNREIYEEKEMIEYFIDKKTKGHFLVDDAIKREHYEAYDRFKRGLEAAGTPLNQWDALNYEEVVTLAKEGIFSVEQFATLPRSRVEGRFIPSIVEAFDRAIRFVATKHERVDLDKYAEEMKRMTEENNKTKLEMEALREQMKALLTMSPDEEEEEDSEEGEPSLEIPADSFNVSSKKRGRPKKSIKLMES